MTANKWIEVNEQIPYWNKKSKFLRLKEKNVEQDFITFVLGKFTGDLFYYFNPQTNNEEILDISRWDVTHYMDIPDSFII